MLKTGVMMRKIQLCITEIHFYVYLNRKKTVFFIIFHSITDLLFLSKCSDCIRCLLKTNFINPKLLNGCYNKVKRKNATNLATCIITNEFFWTEKLFQNQYPTYEITGSMRPNCGRLCKFVTWMWLGLRTLS